MESNDQGRVSIDPKVIKQDRELQIKNLAITSSTSLPKGCGKLISVDVLDKIRAEIEEMTPTYHNGDWSIKDLVPISNVIKIIDKYRARK